MWSHFVPEANRGGYWRLRFRPHRRGRIIVTKNRVFWLVAGLALWPFFHALRASQGKPSEPRPRNVLIFVFDGLRAGSVNAADSPTMFSIREHGVSFPNSHSLFPTFTTANASAIATGHYLGDTGDYSNQIYIGRPIF